MKDVPVSGAWERMEKSAECVGRAGGHNIYVVMVGQWLFKADLLTDSSSFHSM
jgi:hypothetical protein